MEKLITAIDLKKEFNRRVIFQRISFSLAVGETLLITGKNGSGKSTLMKVIAHVLTPTHGTFIFGGDTSEGSYPHSRLGFVSPYLNLYDELSARENLIFALSIRGLDHQRFPIDELLDRTGLARFKNSPLRVFSSGMKQRLKYAFALIHNPSILLLDEPMSNLDSEGKDLVRQLMAAQSERGALIIATNDANEVEEYTTMVNLDVRV